jgi:aspartyl-tRNA synthetase
MKQFFCTDIIKMKGEEVELFGWINNRRDHGKLIFLDLRDKSGLAQMIVLPNSGAYEMAQKLGPEFVVRVKGKINERPEKMVNKDLTTGEVEIEVEEIEILSEAKPPVFEVNKDTSKVKEEVRLKYRYLDLRSERMKNNLIKRQEMTQALRDYLLGNHFLEIETPDLTKGTPEGAREYVVPSRVHKGKFYVLPQSPQQFKQLLMVAGLERYFQFARCFRDEDPRGDRQPEFTQLDIEMSFIKEKHLMELMEEMVISAVAKVYPNKKIKEIPFPRLTYAEAMEKYETDKPDLRKEPKDENELAFAWIYDMPLVEWSETEKKLVSTHHPFTMPKVEDEKHLDSAPDQVKAEAYDLVLNGFEIGGGSIRIHRADLQKKIFQVLGLNDDEIQNKFGHMLEAFSYGVPPHGGIAFGFDRLMMILQNETSIREVIPFPKTGDGRDLMMDAPSEIDPKQLPELGIEIKKLKS